MFPPSLDTFSTLGVYYRDILPGIGEPDRID
jgi:hypothetical protein